MIMESTTKPFKEMIEEHLASGETRLPAFDKTALKIQQEITKSEPDFEMIRKLIREDQALTAQVLKMANTAFFSGLSKVETVRDAIVRLGIEQISNIVILVTQKQIFKPSNRHASEFMEKLWRHSVGTAIGSSWLAKKSGYPQIASQAFVAGLLHDIGKLFLLTVIESIHAKKTYNFNPSREFVTEIMDSLHTEQGWLLTQNWNLPEAYCLVARDHHVEDFDNRNTLLVLVRMVDMTCNKMGIGLHEPQEQILVATPEAVALGLSEVDIAELEIMLEDAPLLSL
jgi:HD-like signal output (HDOD) protein